MLRVRPGAAPDRAPAFGVAFPTGSGAARTGGLGWVGAVTVAADLAAIAAAFALGAVIADAVRAAFDVAPIPVTDAIAGRGTELPILAALMIGVFAFGGLYRRATWEIEEIKRIVQGVALVALFDAAMQFAIKDHSSRLWFFAAYPLVALSVIGARSALRAVPGVRAAMTSHVVLIGSGMAPDLMMHELRESRAGHVQLARTMGFDQIDGHDPGRLLALLGRLAARLGVPAERVQILLAPAAGEQAQAQAAIAHLDAAGCPYSVVLPFDGLSRHGFHVHKVVGADVVIADLTPMGERRLSRGLKRAIDLGLAIPGAILTAPLLAAIAALLLREGGPVLFAQCRVGRGGRRFRCFKFRTMLPDAETRLADLLRRDPGAR
ncbi:MAG: sugar transferase, partial [Thermohalobaculum sp.]|nr:sugar transferase [Thermohalobaculum sp.]